MPLLSPLLWGIRGVIWGKRKGDIHATWRENDGVNALKGDSYPPDPQMLPLGCVAVAKSSTAPSCRGLS